ncbi:polysaccharide pyruvyl transferase family protein, partial [Empedobacter falsenii]|uniref:polysaccharide pyruvyl transferase family protein n=2 Tax=Weeksellaceae TaxID=2762318 RepID=UPI001C59C496
DYIIDTTDKIDKNNRFKNLGILDTSVTSFNLGDNIIMESINLHLNDTFDSNAYFTTYPTHISINNVEREWLLEKEFLFVSGTNLLNGSMEKFRSWRIRKDDLSYYYKRCVLLGVGWGLYDDVITEETQLILKTILSDKVIHSVRDEYTKNKLKSIGINNVINTCCPTTWNLNQQSFNNLKSNNVVTTITDYDKDYENDLKMLKMLKLHYNEVYIWIQSIKDLDYLEEINPNNELGLRFISPNLNAYQKFLDANISNIDYLGTRLHAGIYAMQRGIRTLIIGIDNRALEIGKDINLNVIKRDDIESITPFLKSKDYILPTLTVPLDSINQWKNQFK